MVTPREKANDERIGGNDDRVLVSIVWKNDDSLEVALIYEKRIEVLAVVRDNSQTEDQT